MKSKNRILTGLLMASLLCGAIAMADDATNTTKTSTSSKIDELFPDVVVAKGTGIEIKRSRLDEEISGFKSAATAQGRELTPRNLPLIEKLAYDHLVDLTLLNATATPADKEKAKALTEKQIGTLMKAEPNPGAFEAKLKAMNLTTNQLQSRLFDEAVMAEVLRRQIKVSDDDVKKYYTDNPSRFEDPEKVKLNHILFLTVDRTRIPISAEEKKSKLAKAEEAAKKAKDGADFAKLVDDYSEDISSKENHGEITIFRDSGRVPKQFEAAAFSLSKGQVSEVVVSEVGYHVIKALERTPAKKIEFETVKADLRNYLESAEIAKALPNIAKPLKDAAKIEIMDEQLKNSLQAAEDVIKRNNEMNAAVPKDAIKPGTPATK